MTNCEIPESMQWQHDDKALGPWNPIKLVSNGFKAF